MSDVRNVLERQCAEARAGARVLARTERRQKDAVLVDLADRLVRRTEAILKANAEDVAAAHAAGLSEALVDRLVLDAERVKQIAHAVQQIASFDDPVGELVGMRRRPNGLLVGQQRIPLGVIAMIYESRPNVTVDAAALCLKSGNAVLLRGGKEAVQSNRILGETFREALEAQGLPPGVVQIVAPMGREATKVMLGMTGQIDLLIPRGGEGLIRFVVENARVPVVQHYKGVCHLYIDADADLDMAFSLVENGKLSRPGVCNALECVLVDVAVAEAFLPRLKGLVDEGLEVRGDAATCAAVPRAKPARQEDWGEEFLAPVLAVRVVEGFDAALEHIDRYGSNHTEAICSRSLERATRFQREVDASCVMINASTRFNDGGMLGLGAEVGISTTKLHAYGPMGLASLTTLKWVVTGEGQVR